MGYNETPNRKFTMRNRIAIARMYATVYATVAANRVVNATQDTIELAKDNQSELACIGGTAVVVGLAARVNGFRAGYAYAQSN